MSFRQLSGSGKKRCVKGHDGYKQVTEKHKRKEKEIVSILLNSGETTVVH